MAKYIVRVGSEEIEVEATEDHELVTVMVAESRETIFGIDFGPAAVEVGDWQDPNARSGYNEAEWMSVKQYLAPSA